MFFGELTNFIQNRMRMSHIYQPVMILTLLRNQGRCHESNIAKAILEYDQSQIEYYTKITNNMVGRVLRNHQIVEKHQQHYTLVDFDTLSPTDIQALITLCEQKLQEYLDKRGRAIWNHRNRTAGYISGTHSGRISQTCPF